jgi:hypothetical protein
MTVTNPDADVRLGDVYDFEGVPRALHRHCDVVAIPAMEIGLDGIAQLRAALDVGEPGIREYIREYLARTGRRELPWHGGEHSLAEEADTEAEYRAEVEGWELRHADYADVNGPMYGKGAPHSPAAVDGEGSDVD